jgi:hypothetical protein
MLTTERKTPVKVDATNTITLKNEKDKTIAALNSNEQTPETQPESNNKWQNLLIK